MSSTTSVFSLKSCSTKNRFYIDSNSHPRHLQVETAQTPGAVWRPGLYYYKQLRAIIGLLLAELLKQLTLKLTMMKSLLAAITGS